MSFDIGLYNNQDPLNKITKSPTAVLTVTGTLKEQTDIVNPVIIVETASLPVVNYARIEMFRRWYFITDIQSVRNGLWEIHMRCDVLKTYAEGILACKAVVARQENVYNLYIDDSAFLVEQDCSYARYNFPNGFPAPTMIMITNGVGWQGGPST